MTHISIFPRDVVDHELVTPVDVELPVPAGVVFTCEKIVFPFQIHVRYVDFGSLSYFFHVLSHIALASISAMLYLPDLSIRKSVCIVRVPRGIAPVDVELPVPAGVAGVVGFGVVVVVVPVLVTTRVPYPFESSFVPFQTQENLLLAGNRDASSAQ